MARPTVAAVVEGGVIEVRGAERARYLHAVLTQDVEGLSPGRVAGALHLDAQGRPLAAVDVASLPDRLLLLTPTADVARELSDTLGSRTFLADATFAPLELETVALRGEDAHSIAGRALAEVRAGEVVEDDGTIVVGREGGVDVLTARADEVIDALAAAGAQRGDATDVDRWRVHAGIPAWAREVRAPHLPEEMGLLPSHVHLDKGCYPGQEAVARMWMLGRPRRRLARVRLVGAVAPGWSSGSGRSAVEVTSAAELDGDRVGLAYVPPDARPGDRFGDDEAAVIVRDLVAAERPVPGHDPSVQRRRDAPRERRAAGGTRSQA